MIRRAKNRPIEASAKYMTVIVKLGNNAHNSRFTTIKDTSSSTLRSYNKRIRNRMYEVSEETNVTFRPHATILRRIATKKAIRSLEISHDGSAYSTVNWRGREGWRKG